MLQRGASHHRGGQLDLLTWKTIEDVSPTHWLYMTVVNRSGPHAGGNISWMGEDSLASLELHARY